VKNIIVTLSLLASVGCAEVNFKSPITVTQELGDAYRRTTTFKYSHSFIVKCGYVTTSSFTRSAGTYKLISRDKTPLLFKVAGVVFRPTDAVMFSSSSAFNRVFAECVTNPLLFTPANEQHTVDVYVRTN